MIQKEKLVTINTALMHHIETPSTLLEIKPEGPGITTTQPIDATLAERGSRYGDFMGHATITDDIKQAMQRSKNWAKIAPDQREALDMVAHKIGRILNGDPDYVDSWHDICGYVRLVENRLNGEQK